MDVYLNRTLELGHKIPYGASDFTLQISQHTYFVGNPSRPGASFPVKLKAGVYCGETEVLNLVAEVQPATKAHECGYVFKYEPGIGPTEPDRILAYMGSHPHSAAVGELTYNASGAYLEDQEVQVAPEHQRRGIATAMYQQAEALTGKQFLSRLGEVMPVDAAAFWASPDRPFGVDALYSQPRRQLWVNLADLLPAALKELPAVVFDAERFTVSASGKRCIEMANSGAGPRVGLQEARIRGLMARGHDGLVTAFVHDPHAPPKLLRGVNGQAQPTTLALSTSKGLPDTSIAPPLALLTPEAREAALHFVARHLLAMADLDALDILHEQIRVLARQRGNHHESGDPTAIERALALRRTQAISVMTDLLEKEADFKASQM
jgi:GNAT superfamily N-acetyltransferase